MDLTIVVFTVFNQQHTHIFEDKSLDQIHTDLASIWQTYEPLKIFNCSDARSVDLKVLTKFKDQERMKYNIKAVYTQYHPGFDITIHTLTEPTPGVFESHFHKWHNHEYPSHYLINQTIEKGHIHSTEEAKKFFTEFADKF